MSGVDALECFLDMTRPFKPPTMKRGRGRPHTHGGAEWRHTEAIVRAMRRHRCGWRKAARIVAGVRDDRGFRRAWGYVQDNLLDFIVDDLHDAAREDRLMAGEAAVLDAAA